MTDENTQPYEEKKPDEEPGVLSKPLPVILEEMEYNIRAATGAARQAAEAARKASEELATEITRKAEGAIREAKKTEQVAMNVSQEAASRVQEAKKASVEAIVGISKKTEEIIKESKKTQEVTVIASQVVAKKAEELKRVSEEIITEAITKAEQTVEAATEEDIPRAVIRKILCSKGFLVLVLTVLIGSVGGAVLISLGLSLLATR